MLAFTAAALASGAVRAGDIPGYPDSIFAFDAREMALLPRYCKYTKTFRENVPGGNDVDKIEQFRRTLGPSFEHTHHYCNGLMDTNRALLLAREQRIRWFYLDASIKEFDYVIANADHDYVLLPEIWTKKGENLVRLGRVTLALQAFETAIKLKPDYWPPYVALSDYYKKAGHIAEARDWLEKALAFAPGTKALTTRMAELQAAK